MSGSWLEWQAFIENLVKKQGGKNADLTSTAIVNENPAVVTDYCGKVDCV